MLPSAPAHGLEHRGASFCLAGEARNRELCGVRGGDPLGHSDRDKLLPEIEAHSGASGALGAQGALHAPNVPSNFSRIISGSNSCDASREGKHPTYEQLKFQFAAAEQDAERMRVLSEESASASGTEFPAGSAPAAVLPERHAMSMCTAHRGLKNSPATVLWEIPTRGDTADRGRGALAGLSSFGGQAGQVSKDNRGSQGDQAAPGLSFSPSRGGDADVESTTDPGVQPFYASERTPSFDCLIANQAHLAALSPEEHRPADGSPGQRAIAAPVHGTVYDKAGNRSLHVSQQSMCIPEYCSRHGEAFHVDRRVFGTSVRRSTSVSSLCQPSRQNQPGRVAPVQWLFCEPQAPGRHSPVRGDPEGLAEQIPSACNVRQHVIDDSPVVEPVRASGGSLEPSPSATGR